MSNARELAQLPNKAGRKNILYNGNFTVAQRGTSTASFGGAGSFAYACCDRWACGAVGGTYTVSQSTDAPAGYSHSLKWQTTTADATLDAGDYAYFQQYLEGKDLQDLKFGTANAKSITLSFWIKCSLTGDMAVGFYAGSSRNIGATVTITTADTWEFHSVTFDGDTVASIDNDVTEGLRPWFWLSAGSTYTGTSNTSWQTYASSAAADGQTLNMQGTLNATFYLAGVQMEIGTVATDFEYRTYGEELALCQRYYYRSTNQSILNGYMTLNGYLYLSHDLPVTMRTNPSVTLTYIGAGGSIGTATAPIIAAGSISPTGYYVYKQATVGTGQGYTVYYHTADAEL